MRTRSWLIVCGLAAALGCGGATETEVVEIDIDPETPIQADEGVSNFFMAAYDSSNNKKIGVSRKSALIQFL